MLLLLFSYSITLPDTKEVVVGETEKFSTIIIMRYLLSRIERERYRIVNGNLKHSIRKFFPHKAESLSVVFAQPDHPWY